MKVCPPYDSKIPRRHWRHPNADLPSTRSPNSCCCCFDLVHHCSLFSALSCLALFWVLYNGLGDDFLLGCGDVVTRPVVVVVVRLSDRRYRRFRKDKN